MENQGNSPELKEFARKIIALDIGLLLVAGVVALSLNLDFSIILFALGMMVATIGAYLGGPNSQEPKNPRIQQLNPNEKLLARILSNIKNSVPQFAFENVLLFAGFIALLFSMPFLCQIMF